MSAAPVKLPIASKPQPLPLPFHANPKRRIDRRRPDLPCLAYGRLFSLPLTFPPMIKQTLPADIKTALDQVAAIADELAATYIESGSESFAGMNVAAVLNNLDQVASSLTWKDLEDAPAMLNAAARAFRQTFDGLSNGFAAAGRLQTIAYMIERASADQYMKENPAAVADFYHKPENPMSTL